MSFFEGKLQYKVGIKLRDAIIDHCSKIDTIDISIDDRLTIITHEEQKRIHNKEWTSNYKSTFPTSDLICKGNKCEN